MPRSVPRSSPPSRSPRRVDRTFGDDNVLTLDGAPQRALRAMLDPSFRPRSVREYALPLIEPLVEEHLERMVAAGPRRADGRLLRADLGARARARAGAGRDRRRHAAPLVRRPRPGRDQLRGGPGQAGDRRRGEPRDRRAARARLRAAAGRAATARTIANMLRPPRARSPSARRRSCRRSRWCCSAACRSPATRPGRRSRACSRTRIRPPRSRRIPPASSRRRSRRGCAGSRRSAHRRGASWPSTELGGVALPAGANVGLLVSSANRDERVCGATAERTTSPARSSGAAVLRLRPALLHRARVLAHPRCSSPCDGCSSACRACRWIPSDPPGCAAGSSAPRRTCTCAGSGQAASAMPGRTP